MLHSFSLFALIRENENVAIHLARKLNKCGQQNAREEFQPKKSKCENKIDEQERDSFHSTQTKPNETEVLGQEKREKTKKSSDLEIYFAKACIPCLPFDSVVVGDCKQKML